MSNTNRRLYLTIASIVFLLGIVLILSGGTITVAVGTSLFAGGIVSLMEFWYRLLLSDETSKAKQLLDSGLARVYDHRDLPYGDAMKNLHERLDISGYSLRAFFESYRDVLTRRLEARQELRVRILVVSPGMPMSQQREQFEGHQPGTFAQNIRNIEQWSAGFPDQVEMRQLNGELTTMVFRMDGVMYVGPQFRHSQSRATPTFEVTGVNKPWMFEAYGKEFDVLWQASERL